MAPGTNERVVSEWVDAFNERDLDGMLARVNPDVLFHPLRVNGTAHSYLGHDGMRRWFAEILHREHPHRIGLESIAGLADGRILAAGTVLVENEAGAPFSGLYEIDNGVIVCAYHYFTPAETLFQIGIVR